MEDIVESIEYADSSLARDEKEAVSEGQGHTQLGQTVCD